MTNRVFKQYHLKAPFNESYKLIRHIRFIHNLGILAKISHEDVEDGYTFVCIILKSNTTIGNHAIAMSNLESMGLKAI